MKINYNKIVKELLNESIIIPNIKFLSFSPDEILKYKDAKEFYIIRPNSYLTDYNLMDFIKTEWGKIYKIEDIQFFQNLEDYPFLNLLSKNEIMNLSNFTETFKMLKLVKVVKKEVHRFFYDCEFDESRYGIKLISIGIVDENGNELYLINKDYDWSCTSKWLKENVYPYIKNAPEYFKVSYNEIANKIINFIKPSLDKDIKLYGYYSAYDHVVLCQIFGKMIDLPKGMPMYTNDLKQFMDYLGIDKHQLFSETEKQKNEHDALQDAKWNLKLYNAIKKKYNINI